MLVSHVWHNLLISSWANTIGLSDCHSRCTAENFSDQWSSLDQTESSQNYCKTKLHIFLKYLHIHQCTTKEIRTRRAKIPKRKETQKSESYIDHFTDSKHLLISKLNMYWSRDQESTENQLPGGD